MRFDMMAGVTWLLQSAGNRRFLTPRCPAPCLLKLLLSFQNAHALEHELESAARAVKERVTTATGKASKNVSAALETLSQPPAVQLSKAAGLMESLLPPVRTGGGGGHHHHHHGHGSGSPHAVPSAGIASAAAMSPLALVFASTPRDENSSSSSSSSSAHGADLDGPGSGAGSSADDDETAISLLGGAGATDAPADTGRAAAIPCEPLDSPVPDELGEDSDDDDGDGVRAEGEGLLGRGGPDEDEDAPEPLAEREGGDGDGDSESQEELSALDADTKKRRAQRAGGRASASAPSHTLLLPWSVPKRVMPDKLLSLSVPPDTCRSWTATRTPAPSAVDLYAQAPDDSQFEDLCATPCGSPAPCSGGLRMFWHHNFYSDVHNARQASTGI